MELYTPITPLDLVVSLQADGSTGLQRKLSRMPTMFDTIFMAFSVCVQPNDCRRFRRTINQTIEVNLSVFCGCFFCFKRSTIEDRNNIQ